MGLSEINSFRGDIPVEIQELSPVLYEYLKELADSMRGFGMGAVTGSLTLTERELTTRYFKQEYPRGVETKARVGDSAVSVKFVKFGYEVASGNTGQLAFLSPEGLATESGADLSLGGVDFTNSGAGDYGWIQTQGLVGGTTDWGVDGEAGDSIYLSAGVLSTTAGGVRVGQKAATGIVLSQNQQTHVDVPPDLSIQVVDLQTGLAGAEQKLSSAATDLEFLAALVAAHQDANQVAIARLESANTGLDLGELTRKMASLSLTQAGYELKLSSITSQVESNALVARESAEALFTQIVRADSGAGQAGFWAEVSERINLDVAVLTNDTETALASQQSQITAVATVNTAQATSITSLTASVNSLNTTVGGHTTTLATHTTDIAAVVSVNSAQATSITSLNSSVSGLNSTVSSHTSTLSSHATSISSLTSSTTALTSTVNGHTATLTIQASTNATVAGKLAAYWTLTAVAGGRAQLSIYADANGGGGVDIVGNVTIDGNLLVNGSIMTGKIGDSQVLTAKMGADAVTDITGASATGASGNGSSQTILSANVVMDFAGDIAVIFTALQSFAGDRSWSFQLYIDSSYVFACNGTKPGDSISLAGFKSVGAGTIPVNVYWTGQNSGITMVSGNAVMIRRYR